MGIVVVVVAVATAVNKQFSNFSRTTWVNVNNHHDDWYLVLMQPVATIVQ